MSILNMVIIVAVTVNLFTMITELTMTHPSTSAHTVVEMITKGRYNNLFWIGVVLIGNILPVALLLLIPSTMTLTFVAFFILLGIFATEKIWVEAPQRIPLA
jgi:hypothetical protein